jgi:hypothetical protein
MHEEKSAASAASGAAAEVGDLVLVRVSGTGRFGGAVNVWFEGDGASSRAPMRMMVEKKLLPGKESWAEIKGYLRTIGKKGGLLLTYYPNRGLSASLSSKHIKSIVVLVKGKEPK